MEAAGLGLSVVGLLSVCLELVERFDTYKSFGLDSQHLVNRFEAKKLRLKEWAKAVGVLDGPLAVDHNSRLDDPEVATVVKPILQNLRGVLKTAQGSRDRLNARHSGPNQNLAALSIVLDDNQIGKSRLDHRSMKDGFRWAVKGKAQFTSQVEMMSVLIDQLFEIVPPGADMNLIHQTIKDYADISHILVSHQHRVDLLFEKYTRDQMKLARKEIKKWLDIVRDDERYEKCLSDRLEGTCSWILQHPEYHAWLSVDPSEDASKFLWINAPAGHGKSVLCAWLIQNLRTDSNMKVVCFFSSNEAQNGGDTTEILRLWLSQLVELDEAAFDIVHYRLESNPKAQIASTTEVWTTFVSVVEAIEKLVLVLDGFDEFSQANDNRRKFLRKLKEVVAGKGIRCLVTGRPEPDIESELRQIDVQLARQKLFECKLTLKELGSDMYLFSEKIVNTQLPKKNETFRRELAGTLAGKSGGMFLWIKLQQDQLRSGRSDKMLRKIVEGMPTGLDQHYERNWNVIQNYPEDDRDRAVSILRWVAFAQRPLTVAEMTEALVVESDDDDSKCFSMEDMPEEINADYVEGEIKCLCGSFVEVLAGSDQSPLSAWTIRAAHVSVQQYLVSVLPVPIGLDLLFDPVNHHNVQNAQLAQVCLRFLSYESVSGREKQPVPITGYALYKYASESWPYHVNTCGKYVIKLNTMLNKFFSPSNPNFETWANYFESHLDSSSRDETYKVERHNLEGVKTVELSNNGDQKPWPGLYFAAMLGLTFVMKHLYDLGVADINQIYPFTFGTTLQAACAADQMDAFELLLQWNADVNVSAGLYGSPLGAAAHGGLEKFTLHLLGLNADVNIRSNSGYTPLLFACGKSYSGIVSLLIKAGAHVNIRNDLGFSPLSAAVIRGGSTEEISQLLDHGADISVPDNNGTTPVYLAADKGHLSVLKLLLDRGADPSKPNAYGNTALHAATFMGHLDATKLLCDHVVDILTVNKDGTTPLHLAATAGHIEVARELLRRGADPSITENGGLTPLHCAAAEGHIEVVRELLRHGVDASIASKNETTPLLCAAAEGHIEVVRELLRHGVDASIADNNKSIPLHCAAVRGHVEVVRELLRHGVDPSIIENGGLTPLHCAAIEGHIEVVRELLRHGVDASIVSKDESTPLHCAAAEGHIEVVRELLRHGVDLSITENGGLTPLHMAARLGHVEVVRELHRHGVDLSTADNNGWTPINSAARQGHIEVVRELLRHGVDPSIASIGGWAPINSAARQGNIEVVRELLYHGVDASTASKNGWTPLHSAAAEGHIEVVRELIRHGVDLSIVDNGGLTPLHLAALDGYVEVVRELLRHGVNTSITSKDRWTPLHSAAAKGYIEVVRELLRHGVDLSIADNGGLTPLHSAALNGYVEVVRELLRHGLDPSIAENGGLTPLHCAANQGHIEVVRELLRHGVDPSIAENGELTPLHYAVIQGHIEVVRELLRHGVDLSIVDNGGLTPLHWAAVRGHVEVVRELLRHGVDPSIAGNGGLTPLHCAAGRGHIEVVRELIYSGQAASIADNSNETTPLHLAALNGHTGVVRALIDHGADASSCRQGGTLVQMAARKGHSDVVRELINRGANLNQQDGEGFTLLHRAVCLGLEDLCETLVSLGADQNVVDIYGRNVSDWVKVLGTRNLKLMFDAEETLGDSSESEINPRLSQCARDIAAQLLQPENNEEEEKKSKFRIIAQCFSFIGDFQRAAYAMQQGTHDIDCEGLATHVAVCCLCDKFPIQGTLHVCKVCPDITLCSSCIEKIPEEGINAACRGHSFFEVPTPAAYISSGKCPAWEVTAENRLWLEEIVNQGVGGEEQEIPVR